MAELRLTRRARRDLEALPPGVQAAVVETLTAIGADPEASGKQLLGRLRGLWSARVGSYRILYTLEKGKVVVRAIRHRAVAYPQHRSPGWMIEGNMACGVMGDGLLVRLGPERAERALAQEHVGPMEFTGRRMGGFVVVEAEGVADDAALGLWVDTGAEFAAGLPPKTD